MKDQMLRLFLSNAHKNQDLEELHKNHVLSKRDFY